METYEVCALCNYALANGIRDLEESDNHLQEDLARVKEGIRLLEREGIELYERQGYCDTCDSDTCGCEVQQDPYFSFNRCEICGGLPGSRILMEGFGE